MQTVPENNSSAVVSVNSDDEEYEYVYDYDLSESLSLFDWAELGPSLAVYSVTFALGVVGNLLILAAVARHTHVKSSPVNVFLASLASADLMLILTCLPLKVREGTLAQLKVRSAIPEPGKTL